MSSMAAHNRCCAVKGCKSSLKTTPLLSFYALPKEETRRQKWISLINREDILQKTTLYTSYRVCAIHFHPSVLENRRLKNYALPTERLPRLGGETDLQDDDEPSNLPLEYKKSFTVETQTHKTSFIMMQESQTQTDDIGLEPITLINKEINGGSTEAFSKDDSASDDVDFDELSLSTDLLSTVKIPIIKEENQSDEDSQIQIVNVQNSIVSHVIIGKRINGQTRDTDDEAKRQKT